jgi:hypothetical protein
MLKLNSKFSVVVSVVAALSWAIPAGAQTQPTPAELEAMMESLRPTTEHALLAGLEGRWTQDVTYQMGGPPMQATGTLTNRLILGGRFLMSEGTSNNPMGFGDPTVEVMAVYGFDRRVNQYTIVGYDTMGTYYVTAAGGRRSDGLVLMSGETLEHEAGTSVMRRYDMTLRIVDADTYITEIIFKFPGRPDQTVVSIRHRRIK